MMDEQFYELAAQIAAWHEYTFPDATEESQILKLNEEFGKYADGEFIEELADVFIVAASLSERWGNMMGTFTMKAVVKHAGKDADLMKTFIEYQKEAAKTIPAEFDGETMIDNAVYGLCGEVGECVDRPKQRP